MSALAKLASMLGIGDHQAEDALHSERAARAVLTRRSLFAAGAALATGAVFSMPLPEPAGFWVVYHPAAPGPEVMALAKEMLRARMRADIVFGRVRFPPSVHAELGFEALSGHKPRDNGGRV